MSKLEIGLVTFFTLLLGLLLTFWLYPVPNSGGLAIIFTLSFAVVLVVYGVAKHFSRRKKNAKE